MQFTDDQKEFLKAVYNLDITDEDSYYKVRDGYVQLGDMLWWRSAQGPQQIVFEESNTTHFDNVKSNPSLYQINEPQYTTSIVYQ